MKKLIILILVMLFINLCNIFSQEIIDPPIIVTQRDTIIDFNNTDIFDKNFSSYILGWNYGLMGKPFDQLMKSNLYLKGWNTGEKIDWANYGDSSRWYLTIGPLNSLNDASVCVTQSLLFEPSIEVNDIQKSDAFTPTSNHSNGAVLRLICSQSGISREEFIDA